MNKIYRQGAAGALLDIYEQAILELKNTFSEVPDNALTVITDPHTADENCKSIQAILSHVVHAGYGYATSIQNMKGHNLTRPDKIFHLTTSEYAQDMDNLFIYTENVFKEINDNELEQYDNSLKMKTGWGQFYDIEQLTEHAIVHILRHKRQIEKIKQPVL